MNRLRARRVRLFALAALCGLAVGAIVVALLLNRPPVYAAQNSLIARPEAAAPGAQDSAGQFGEVVALGLPALPDLAVSPSVLDTVTRTVPGAPTVDELGALVEVTLVPGAGVAKLTVRADNPDLAAREATALVDALVATDILQPAARLVPLDAEPQVVRVGTSIPTVGGIALITAIAVSAAAYGALRRIRPAGTDVHEVHTAMSRAGRPTVAILDGRDPTLIDRLCALQRAGGLPLRIITIGPGQTERADALRKAVGGRGVQLSSSSNPAPQSAPTSVVAVFDSRSTRPDELTAVAAALPERSSMLAVVLL